MNKFISVVNTIATRILQTAMILASLFCVFAVWVIFFTDEPGAEVEAMAVPQTAAVLDSWVASDPSVLEAAHDGTQWTVYLGNGYADMAPTPALLFCSFYHGQGLPIKERAGPQVIQAVFRGVENGEQVEKSMGSTNCKTWESVENPGYLKWMKARQTVLSFFTGLERISKMDYFTNPGPANWIVYLEDEPYSEYSLEVRTESIASVACTFLTSKDQTNLVSLVGAEPARMIHADSGTHSVMVLPKELIGLEDTLDIRDYSLGWSDCEIEDHFEK